MGKNEGDFTGLPELRLSGRTKEENCGGYVNSRHREDERGDSKAPNMVREKLCTETIKKRKKKVSDKSGTKKRV